MGRGFRQRMVKHSQVSEHVDSKITTINVHSQVGVQVGGGWLDVTLFIFSWMDGC